MHQHHTHVVPLRERFTCFLQRCFRRFFYKVLWHKPKVALIFGPCHAGKGHTEREVRASVQAQNLTVHTIDMGEVLRAPAIKRCFSQWTSEGLAVPNKEVKLVLLRECAKVPLLTDLIIVIGVPRYNEGQVPMTWDALASCGYDKRHTGIVMEAERSTVMTSLEKAKRLRDDDKPEIVAKRYQEWREDSSRIAELYLHRCFRIIRFNRETVTREDRINVAEAIVTQAPGMRFDKALAYRALRLLDKEESHKVASKTEEGGETILFA